MFLFFLKMIFSSYFDSNQNYCIYREQIYQHGVVDPNIKESEMPVITREAQADHEVSDYDIRMPQLSSQ